MHLHDQKPWEGESLQSPAPSHGQQSHPCRAIPKEQSRLDWQEKKALGQIPAPNPCTPPALPLLRWESTWTYLKVRPSKMGVKGSLKVWHRVMAESKSPARTSRDTVSSGVELPEREGEQVKPLPVTPQCSLGPRPVLVIERCSSQQPPTPHSSIPKSIAGGFAGLQSIPGVIPEGTGQSSCDPQSCPCLSWRGTQRDRKMLLLFTIREFLRLGKDPQDH